MNYSLYSVVVVCVFFNSVVASVTPKFGPTPYPIFLAFFLSGLYVCYYSEKLLEQMYNLSFSLKRSSTFISFTVLSLLDVKPFWSAIATFSSRAIRIQKFIASLQKCCKGAVISKEMVALCQAWLAHGLPNALRVDTSGCCQHVVDFCPLSGFEKAFSSG